MIDRYGKRKGRNAVEADPQLREILEGLLLRSAHLGTAQLYRIVQAQYSGNVPSYDVVRRWINSYKADPLGAALFTYAHDPNEYRNKFEPALGSRSEHVSALNDLWELDSTLSDTLWELNDGKRYAILGCIDVYSRRARVLVNPVSNSEAICLLLRRCLLEWGVPKTVKTDNGKDYTSHRLTTFLKSLEVTHKLCTPFTPQEKPHIERFLGHFNHSFVPYLEGFLGHNVAQRQAIRAREKTADGPESVELKLVRLDRSVEDFQAWCDQWIDWYMQQPHGGIGDKRPLELIGGQPRVEVAERALDILLMEAPGGEGKRIVQKKGVAVGRLPDGKTAWHIGDWMGDPGMIGSTVYVRLDPSDLGVVYVYRDQLCREFLGRAGCPERTGESRKVVAMQAKERNKLVRRTASKRKSLTKDFRVAAAQQRILNQATEGASKVHCLPGAVTTHAVTEAVNLALKEFEPRPVQTPLSPERIAELAEYLQPQEELPTDLELYHKLRSRAPESLNQKEFEWMAWYCKLPQSKHIVMPALDFYPHLQVYLDEPQQATG